MLNTKGSPAAISASILSLRVVQQFLFLAPYIVILWTGMLLSLAQVGNLDDGEDPDHKNENRTRSSCIPELLRERLLRKIYHHDDSVVVSQALGILNVSLFGMYWFGYLGNHYLKVYTFLLNLVAFVPLLLFRQFHTCTILAIDFLLPCIALVIILIKIPLITEVIPEQLFLGNCAVATNPTILQKYNITHVLEVTDRRIENDSSTVHAVVEKITLLDDLGGDNDHNWRTEVAIKGYNFLDSCLSTKQEAHVSDNNQTKNSKRSAVLVHCAAGTSRSPAVILYYLVTTRCNGMDLTPAYAFLQRRRPTIDINVDHMKSIKAILREEKLNKNHTSPKECSASQGR